MQQVCWLVFGKPFLSKMSASGLIFFFVHVIWVKNLSMNPSDWWLFASLYVQPFVNTELRAEMDWMCVLVLTGRSSHAHILPTEYTCGTCGPWGLGGLRMRTFTSSPPLPVDWTERDQRSICTFACLHPVFREGLASLVVRASSWCSWSEGSEESCPLDFSSQGTGAHLHLHMTSCHAGETP